MKERPEAPVAETGVVASVEVRSEVNPRQARRRALVDSGSLDERCRIRPSAPSQPHALSTFEDRFQGGNEASNVSRLSLRRIRGNAQVRKPVGNGKQPTGERRFPRDPDV